MTAELHLGLTTFVVSSIAALRELPRDSGSLRCLRLFLIGASRAYWDTHSLRRDRFAPTVVEVLRHHGLPDSETVRLIESLPYLYNDPVARYMLDQGAEAMREHLDSQDSTPAPGIHERVAEWQRAGVCRDRESDSSTA